MTYTQKITALFVLFSFNFSQASNLCAAHFGDGSILPREVQEKYPVLAKSQPKAVRLLGYQVLLRNQELYPYLKMISEKQDRKSVGELVKLLHQHQTFDFPLTQEGYLPAANNGGHHGGYGSYVWYRDLARAMTGVSALPSLLNMANLPTRSASSAVPKFGKAMLSLFSEKEQIVRTLQNIFDPEFHKNPHDGYRNVPFIRKGLDGRRSGEKLTKEQIEIESKWGHKQNDALAIYGHSLLDAVAKGDLHTGDVSPDALAEMTYLAAYFKRIKYATMEDVGAWEEGMGLRTSSIALVTSFLERFNDGWTKSTTNDKKFFDRLHQAMNSGEILNSLTRSIKNNPKELSLHQDEGLNIIKEALNDLPDAIRHSYALLYNRLGIEIRNGRRVYTGVKELESDRGADAALLHLLLYPPKGLTFSDRLHIADQVKKNLMRAYGFARYKDDWFLYGNPNAVEFAGQLPFSPDMIAVIEGNNFRSSNRGDRDQVYADYQGQKYNKDMRGIVQKNGADQEAQWAFQDSMLVQIYVQLYKESRDQSHLNTAGFHLSRAVSFITGHDQLNIEGSHVAPWRTPEAEVPVQLIHNGKAFTAYFTSPNSPLNWSTAELVKALHDYMSVLK